MSEIAGVRSWLAWIIASIWLITSLGVLIARHVHPPAEAKATVQVSEITFTTDAPRLIGPTNDREVIVSGLSSVEMKGSIKMSGRDESKAIVENPRLIGDRSSTCVFYNVRRGGIFLTVPSPSRVGLIWNRTNSKLPLGIESAIPTTITLTSQPGKSGLTCTAARLGESDEVKTINAVFSDSGGESISVITSGDSRIDLGPDPTSQIQATQIPILSPIRFAHVDPRGTSEESVLLKATNPSQPNQLNFPTTAKNVSLDDTDLLIVRPRRGFYIKNLSVEEGIHLVLEGPVQDAQKGPGANDLKTVMPSMLDRLLNEKGAFALVPSLVALIVGILEKMGVIPK